MSSVTPARLDGAGGTAAGVPARIVELLAVALVTGALFLGGTALAAEPSLPRSDGEAATAVATRSDGAAGADAIPARGARVAAKEDSTKRRSTPFRVMLRSAVVPGWGQVYNHKYWKAALVVGGEGFLIYKALDELGKENDAIALQSTLSAGTPEYEAAKAAQDEHYNLKINYIWWGIAVHLLQMADAYVDAHLAGFEADLSPGTGDADPSAETRVSLAYRLRF